MELKIKFKEQISEIEMNYFSMNPLYRGALTSLLF